MGAEAKCTAIFRGKTSEGKARLETETLEFRGPDVTLSLPFKQIKTVTARDGALTVHSQQGPVSLALGDQAEKWAFKIQHPPSRLDKIGASPGWRVSVLGISDGAFLEDLERVVSKVSIRRALKDSDAIFVGAAKEADLARLARLKAFLKPSGALWVIRPKGRPEIPERAVMAAGRAAGLVDVKVGAFSPTHTAQKFVIPVHQRRNRT